MPDAAAGRRTSVMRLTDVEGVIADAFHKLPSDGLKVSFLEALAELTDRNAHWTRQFPVTRLHRLQGVSQQVYRADVDKTSGWRIHLIYGPHRHELVLVEVIEGEDHDHASRRVKQRKGRYK